MTTACNEIDKALAYDCDNPPASGQFDEIYIFPKRIIEGYTLNANNPLIVEGIQIASGKCGFKYTGDGTMLKRSYTAISDDYGTRYNHGLPFKMPKADPETMLQIEKLGREIGGVVIIGRQNYKGVNGNAEYYILGRDCGLKATPKDDAGRNINDIMFESVKDAEEPHTPSFLFLTSTAVTAALLASYMVAQTP